jgi:hypothetical protein
MQSARPSDARSSGAVWGLIRPDVGANHGLFQDSTVLIGFSRTGASVPDGVVVKPDIEPGQSQDALNTIGRPCQDQSSVRRLRLRDENGEHADAARVDVFHRPEIRYHSTMASKQTPDARSKLSGCCAVDDGPATRDNCRVALHSRV